MNYAAVLAVLMLLSFAFPGLVQLAHNQGIPASHAVIAGLVVVLALSAWAVIRRQVRRYRSVLSSVLLAKRQIAEEPQNPAAYFVAEHHVSDLLIRLGRHREAKQLRESYSRLSGGERHPQGAPPPLSNRQGEA